MMNLGGLGMFRRFAILFSVCAALVAAPAYATATSAEPLPDLPVLLERAEKGDTVSQNHLGVTFSFMKDYKNAAKWFQKAAQRGDVFAQYRLGYLYSEGLGLPQDHDKATAWFYEAAKKGDIKAQYQMGVAYYKGNGVSANTEKAIDWLMMAAEKGDKSAETYLKFISHQHQALVNQVREKNSVKGQIFDVVEKEVEGSNALGKSLGVVFLQGLGVTMTLEAILLWIVLPLALLIGRFAV